MKQGRECACEECRAGKIEAKPNYRFVYGLDPASKNDYFGCVIHQIPEYVIGVPHLPQLRDLFNIRFLPFDKILEKLQSEYFVKYPPSLMVIDYTNEKTLTDLLVERYGEFRVDPVKFNQGTKLGLKQDGLSVLNMGYQFPNWKKVEDKQRAEWGMELERQLLSEQLVTRPNKTQSFEHPVGDHNDLSTAWELSIKGCMKYLLNKGGSPIVESSMQEDTNFDEMSEDDLFPELKRFNHTLDYKLQLP